MRQIKISLYDWCLNNNRQDLLNEWDKETNEANGIFYDKIGPQSNKYAYWKCKFGHHWMAKVNNRYNGRGCPQCSKRSRTSFPEQAVYFYIKKAFPDAINSYKDIFDHGIELDIYIPSIKTGIEYDGLAWHKDNSIQKERIKYNICRQNGITLFRIKENIDHYKNEKNVADYMILMRKFFNQSINSYNSLDFAINELLYRLGCFKHFDLTDEFVESSYLGARITIEVNTKRDKKYILSNYLTVIESNSLAMLYPEVSKKWHPTKNGELQPYMLSAHSMEKAWWLGECGHEWEASIAVLTRGGGCPYCAGQKVLKGFNDFATKFPERAKLWHPTKNGNKTPDMFTYGSGYKAYWLCPVCNQTWQAKINSRHYNCPYCTHQKPIQGVNDLYTMRPDLIKEWDYTKNSNLSPKELCVNSNKKVWWICGKCGFKYYSSIANRVKGTGCKKCAGQILIPGVNDLQTLYPDIAKEWDFELNDTTPDRIFPKTNNKYFWICSLGHKWKASPNTRCSRSGCPICSGNKVLVGFNDLVTTHPEIAAEWHHTKNGDLKPTDVSRGYKYKVWFMCPDCNNSYDSYIYNKIKGYGKCPYCCNQKTSAKLVLLVEEGKTFKTLKEAANYIGKDDYRNIHSCCVGKSKTAYGYHWKYVNII